MIKVETYSGLPDGMTPSEVRSYIEWLMKSFREEPNFNNVGDFLEALDELADRQWHTYERLEGILHREVEQLLVASLTASISLEEAEHAVSIVARLGFPEALAHLAKLSKEVGSAAVREEIEDSVRELTNTVSDPYSGMSKP